MFKRFLALISFLSLIVLGGYLLLYEPPQPAEESIDPYKFLSEYQNNWQYTALSEEEKIGYGYLYTAIKDAENQESTITYTNENKTTALHPGVRVPFTNLSLTQERFTAVLEAFLRDNPQFFYISRTYHLEGHDSNKESNATFDAVLLQFTLPLEERRTAIQQLSAIVNELISGCPTNADDYEKELYLHDQLANRCVYDTIAADSQADAHHNAYTAYGALIEGKAVCEGYAKAMQLLLLKANLPATVVSGLSLTSGENHMWNQVTIHGENYFLDPTWNDHSNQTQHTYFNLTSEMLRATHTIDDNQPAISECTATQDNYFIRNNAYIDTYEREKIARQIATQLTNGHTTIQLRFAPDKFSNGQLFLKNRTLTIEKVNAYLMGSGLSLWDYQLWADEEQRVLTLTKE